MPFVAIPGVILLAASEISRLVFASRLEPF
jgi:hypothetical protein